MKKWTLFFLFLLGFGISIFYFIDYSLNDNEVKEHIQQRLNIDDVEILNNQSLDSYKVILFDSKSGNNGIYIFKIGLFNRLKPIGSSFDKSDETKIVPYNEEIVIFGGKNDKNDIKTIEVTYGKLLKQKEVGDNFLHIFGVKSQGSKTELQVTLYGENNKILSERKSEF
ncbi:hypothetical protein [Sutcliffiella horikoshii]|uniref:hypothetical protein n=1 Tax=Sutcliffiella horikoshii TaxID=79883 RepID=UPI0038515FE3